MNCPDDETFKLAIKLHNKLRYLSGGNENDQDLVSLLDCLIQDQRIMKNLIRSIEHRIKDLSSIDEDLAYQFECDLYYETDGIDKIEERLTRIEDKVDLLITQLKIEFYKKND